MCNHARVVIENAVSSCNSMDIYAVGPRLICNNSPVKCMESG